MPSKSVDIGPERVELAGSAREIGLEHGRRLAGKIHSQIKVYTSMFLQTSKLNWEDVRSIAKEYAATIEKLTPDIYAEMNGIADGAGLDLLGVVALNCRSEIALAHFSDGCTSMGWTTPKDGVILAQNWDWTVRVKENCVFMSIDQPGKPKIYMVTEAGIVGKIGFNSSSVGATLNAIRAKAMNHTKLPIHVVLRIFLESTSVASATSKLESLGGIASSAHILIADIDGPRSLELSPKGNVYIEPSELGIVCHTNHFISNRFVTEPPWLLGSPLRLERIQKLTRELAHSKKPVSADILRRHVFSDTLNAPQSICCQEDPARPIETRSSTLFCIVMRFSRGRDPSAEVVWGRPGSGDEGPVLSLPW